ncbi:MAG: TatD family hydrolase [Clostridia bacterium]|nr:TatD family hydrolase [Clostridia bacterium]
MNLIFDTHAHYDDKAFDDDREDVIDMLFKNGVCGVVNQGTDIKTSVFSINLAQRYDGFYAAVGLHPECLDENSTNDLDKIKELAKNEKVVAIGEIGLDYYYDIPKDLQKTIFAKQLELAAELDMPVNIHDREAHGDTLEILKQYKPKGIVHCFSGSLEMAKEIIKLGMYIGIGGVVTFKNARKTVEVVENIPLERLVLETDCPYLSPVPFRSKRNDSSMIKYTAQRIAEIRNTTVEEILTITRKNAADVYKINM